VASCTADTAAAATTAAAAATTAVARVAAVAKREVREGTAFLEGCGTAGEERRRKGSRCDGGHSEVVVVVIFMVVFSITVSVVVQIENWIARFIVFTIHIRCSIKEGSFDIHQSFEDFRPLWTEYGIEVATIYSKV
jgi:hypothetical protein